MNRYLFQRAMNHLVKISLKIQISRSMLKDGAGREILDLFNNEGKQIGSITIRFFNKNNKGYGYVSNEVPELGMALLKEFRGNGIGTALLEALFKEAAQKNIKRLSLSVNPKNKVAIKLYHRFGFREVGMVGTSITMVADVIEE